MKDPNADLKKFISQAFSQQGNQLRNEMKVMRQDILSHVDTKLGSFKIDFDAKLDDLRTEMRESFIAVGESFEELRRDRERDMKYINKTFARHDREISILQEKLLP